MNQIKIIKRASLQSSLGDLETQSKKVNPKAIKRRAAAVVENWIDEWRAAKPKDARQAFADLFGASPSAIG